MHEKLSDADIVIARRGFNTISECLVLKKPALFYFSKEDKVVDPNKTKEFIKKWGGETTTKVVKLSNNDDKLSHVLAGYIISPNQTEHARKTMLNWIENLK